MKELAIEVLRRLDSAFEAGEDVLVSDFVEEYGEERFMAVFKDLLGAGLIAEESAEAGFTRSGKYTIDLSKPRITLRGAMYLDCES